MPLQRLAVGAKPSALGSAHNALDGQMMQRPWNLKRTNSPHPPPPQPTPQWRKRRCAVLRGACEVSDALGGGAKGGTPEGDPPGQLHNWSPPENRHPPGRGRARTRCCHTSPGPRSARTSGSWPVHKLFLRNPPRRRPDACPIYHYVFDQTCKRGACPPRREHVGGAQGNDIFMRSPPPSTSVKGASRISENLPPSAPGEPGRRWFSGSPSRQQNSDCRGPSSSLGVRPVARIDDACSCQTASRRGSTRNLLVLVPR